MRLIHDGQVKGLKADRATRPANFGTSKSMRRRVLQHVSDGSVNTVNVAPGAAILEVQEGGSIQIK